jgi:hypothetical protein
MWLLSIKEGSITQGRESFSRSHRPDSGGKFPLIEENIVCADSVASA